MTAALGRLRARAMDFGELVKFSHTIFLFPFAVASVALATRQHPLTLWKIWWIVVALVAARSAAMVMNRIADRRYDAKNPRTATRPLVTGQVSPGLAWAWLAGSCGLFVLASAMLNDACLYLSPVALFWVMGYSFTKRFTALCHLWLGLATALAPVGAWVAMTGGLEWRIWLMAGSVACWVAGFDVIYACLDIDFDRGEGLHSMPAKLGFDGGLWASRALHGLAVTGFAAMAPLFELGGVYLIGVAVVAALLAAEQVLAARKRENIPMAFFTMNGVIAVVYLAFVLADRVLGG